MGKKNIWNSVVSGRTNFWYTRDVKYQECNGDIKGFFYRDASPYGMMPAGVYRGGEAGEILEKEKLLYAVREQIHWINGKNLFVQSLMVGSGRGFGALYEVFSGVCTGQLPVSIQTKKNEDFPYWSAGNQATYREVWTSCTVKMIGICSKILKKSNKNIEL